MSESFGALGVSAEVEQALAARGIAAVSYPVPRRPGRARGPRRPREGRRLREDARLRAADRRARLGRRAGPGRARARPHPRARAPGDRGLVHLGKPKGIRAGAAYGGAPIKAQVKRLRGANVVVATPGRLNDLVQQRLISLEHVRILILDEATGRSTWASSPRSTGSSGACPRSVRRCSSRPRSTARRRARPRRHDQPVAVRGRAALTPCRRRRRARVRSGHRRQQARAADRRARREAELAFVLGAHEAGRRPARPKLRALGHVAVHRGRPDPPCAQLVDEPVGAALRAHEDEGELPLLAERVDQARSSLLASVTATNSCSTSPSAWRRGAARPRTATGWSCRRGRALPTGPSSVAEKSIV